MRITNASEVKPTPQEPKTKSGSKSSSVKDKEAIAALTEKNKILVNVSRPQTVGSNLDPPTFSHFHSIKIYYY